MYYFAHPFSSPAASSVPPIFVCQIDDACLHCAPRVDRHKPHPVLLTNQRPLRWRARAYIALCVGATTQGLAERDRRGWPCRTQLLTQSARMAVAKKEKKTQLMQLFLCSTVAVALSRTCSPQSTGSRAPTLGPVFFLSPSGLLFFLGRGDKEQTKPVCTFLSIHPTVRNRRKTKCGLTWQRCKGGW